MQLERFTTEELISKCRDVFYDYMASSEDFYVCGEFLKCTEEFPTIADMLYDFHNEIIGENESRITLYERAIENPETDKECLDVLNKQLSLLHEERSALLNSSLKTQKELYERTGELDYSRSAIRIPLDKKINSFYDDFTLEVLFYDDVATLKGKHEEYKKLKTFEERRQFIVDNTEITHMGLAYLVENRQIATIGLLGNLNFQDPRIQDAGITLLEHKFSDFNKVTLADTNQIQNNDLKQFIQSKLDLDKEESLKVLADKFVGNDNYKILRNEKGKSMDEEELYIRYICPSTGRVYFNNLNIRNLGLSKFFKEGIYETYIDAWWNLNNLGADPYGKAMIRC